MDETYIKLRGNWHYFYRAVDKQDKTLDFMLSERKSTASATLFIAKALQSNGIPEKIMINRSGANTAGFRTVNKIPKFSACHVPTATNRSKYLNDIVEQDHRFIKKRTHLMLVSRPSNLRLPSCTESR